MIIYGAAERWKKRKDKHGTTKYYKNRANQFINDGRPPDTTEQLLSSNNTGESLKRQKISGRSAAGRPKGSISREKNPMITYPSYKHIDNTCYITSLLESLYSAYSYLVSGVNIDIKSPIKKHFPQTTILG